MKQHSTEWVAIAGLMSAAAATLVALLSVTLARTQLGVSPRAEAGVTQVRQETAQPVRTAPPAEAPREQVASILGEMKSALAQSGAARFVTVDAETGVVTLKEGAFRRGSACIEPEAREAFARVEGRIADYLGQFGNGRIYVEGHTDNKPVKAPVTDYRAFCTVYDDNFTLSAARAREARLLLIGRVGANASRRVIVAGYGDSQPLKDVDPGDERNRRVELRFVNGAEPRR